MASNNDTETLWHHGPDFDGFPIRMSDRETQWRPACCKRWYVYAVKNVCDCWNENLSEGARDVIADVQSAHPRCFHCKQPLQRRGDGFANCACRATASPTPDTGNTQVAAKVEGEGSRDEHSTALPTPPSEGGAS